MKRAVSISLGSSKRNKSVTVNLLGEEITIERIGTDGDMEVAAQKYKELDGKVDAFGVGGADLGLLVDTKWYPLHSVRKMVRFVEQTPIVDGTGLKITLEGTAAAFLDQKIPEHIQEYGRTAFIMTGADRWGLTRSFSEARYDCVFGDLMFSLGIPYAIKSPAQLKTLAALVMPIAGRIPFEWVYPTGEKQEEHAPKHEKYFQWATVTAGDCHYIKRYMPNDMKGKVIVTNTTTPADVELFRECGIKYLATATPVLEGRSFGTNMMEAALIAISGKERVLTHDELKELLNQLEFEPQIQELINMDAVITAGGIPGPEDSLYELTQGKSKALLEIAEKPMVQWVLDALCGSEKIDRIVMVGLEPESGLTCSKPITYISNQGGMLDNVRISVDKVVELNPAADLILLVSSDIPALTTEMVDWAIDAAEETEDDLYYNIISKEVMESRYPGSKRSFIKFKDAEICGGDMNIVRASAASGNDELWTKLVAARKNPLKQAALFGFSTLVLLLTRRLSIHDAGPRASKQLGIRGRAVFCPYAEIGMDVDKPYQFEILRKDLESKSNAS